MTIEKISEGNRKFSSSDVRNKLNETIDVVNNIEIPPAGGGDGSGGSAAEPDDQENFGNVIYDASSKTYIPSDTNFLSTDGASEFAIIVGGKLYIGRGAASSHTFYTGESEGNEYYTGLDQMREFTFGGYYSDNSDVTVINFRLNRYCSLVLTSDGILWGWGENSYGQLNQGHTSTVKLPVIVDTDVREFFHLNANHAATTGDKFAIYWAKNENYEENKGYLYIYGCGYNAHGQLGNDSTSHSYSSVEVNLYDISYDQYKWRIKKVYNFTTQYGGLMLVLQHTQDSRVQHIAACGYNGNGQLGFVNDSGSYQPTLKLATKRDHASHPSFTPTWRMLGDTCSIEIIDIFTGYGGSVNSWVAVWSRVKSSDGNEGDFLRAAGKNTYQSLGSVSKDFGSLSNLNGGKYKTFRIRNLNEVKEEFPSDSILSSISGPGVNYETAKYAASKSNSLAFIQNRAEYNRLHMHLLERAHDETDGVESHNNLWLDMKDDSAEGFYRSSTKYGIHKQARVWSPGQPDDASGEVIVDGSRTVRGGGTGTWDLTAENYLGNGTYNGSAGGFHDVIYLNRNDTSDAHVVLSAYGKKRSGSGTQEDPYEFSVRFWRSEQSGGTSWANKGDDSKIVIYGQGAVTENQGEVNMHNINPHIGKFVQFDDSGDVGYLCWHKTNREFVFARSEDSGSTWQYYNSSIDHGDGLFKPSYSMNIGVSSIVHLGDGVLVAATIGLNAGYSIYTSDENFVIRSLDYGNSWHVISNNNSFNFNGVDIAGDSCSGFFCGKFYDPLSNKYRLLVSGCSGSIAANGVDSTIQNNSLGQNYYNAFFLIYSDDLGENWSTCSIDGQTVNNKVETTSQQEKGDAICGFAQQGRHLYIVRTRHTPITSSYSLNKTVGDHTINWNGSQTLAYSYRSLGGAEFQSFKGIVQENNQFFSRGAELNAGMSGGSGDAYTRVKCQYRIITKVLPFATDGVVISWARMSSQVFGIDNTDAFYDSNITDPHNNDPVNTNYSNVDYWQAPQRFTVISDITNIDTARQYDYLLNNHNLTNTTYKQLADRGTHLYVVPRPNKASASVGNVLIMNGGFANNFDGYSIMASSENLHLSTLSEDGVHVISSNDVFDGSGRQDKSSDTFTKKKGMTLLNDLPLASNSAFSVQTDWLEQKEVAAAGNTSEYVLTDSLDNSLAISVPIPEINTMYDPSASNILVAGERIFIKNIVHMGNYAGGLAVLLSNGKLYTTGYGGTAQRGAKLSLNQSGTSYATTSVAYPTPVPITNIVSPSHSWERIIMSARGFSPGHHDTVFVLDSNGDLWCWGRNSKGECGLGGSTSNIFIPTKVPLPPDVKIRAGSFLSSRSNETTVVLFDSKGNMYAAGGNYYGPISYELNHEYTTRFFKLKNPIV